VADIYSKFQGTAAKLLKKFNQGVIRYIAQPASGANPWDAPTPSSPVLLPGAVASGVSQEFLSEKVTTSDTEVTASVFGATPEVGGVIEIDGVERQVVEVKPVPAAGVVVVWKIFVKG